MDSWRNFEIDCANYLNKKYGAYAKFISFGGANSNVPDITAKTNSGRFFGLEAKYCPAQSGQFVLLPDITTREFVYSRLNASSPNMSACIILYHDFVQFSNVQNAHGSRVCSNLMNHDFRVKSHTLVTR